MKPNIIFILLDGARWDRLHKSQEFTDLENKGTIFDNIITAIPYTFGSMNVLFTGLYGKENGVDAYYKMFRLRDSVDFLPEILQKGGYFTACDLISDKVISSRGFDKYQAHDEYNDDLTVKHPEYLKKCFDEAQGKPLFCFLQFSRIHTVTVSEILKKYEWDNEEFYSLKDENLKIYDSVFEEAGNYAKIMYQTLEKLDKLDNTVIIFFADHGTGVGERFGERNYGVFTYEETIRTFYLFISPKIQRNKKTSKMRSTIDIFPTILEISNLKSENKTFGKSLLPFLEREKDLEEYDYVFSETGGLQGPFPSPKAPNVFSVKTPKIKLIYFKAIEEWKMYDLILDPNESQNIIGKNIEEENLKKVLLDWINRN